MVNLGSGIPNSATSQLCNSKTHPRGFTPGSYLRHLRRPPRGSAALFAEKFYFYGSSPEERGSAAGGEAADTVADEMVKQSFTANRQAEPKSWTEY